MVRALLFLVLLFSVSCGKERSAHPQAARLSLTADPTVLDPRKARNLDDLNLIRMLFEGMTRTAKNGSTELAIAESVQIDNDGLRYVIRLRKSVWSNGDPLTAHDFASAWKTILDPHFVTDIAYQLYPIKNGRRAKLGEIGVDAVGVEALDDQTLVVDLEQPLPYFLELLSMPAFYPVPLKVAVQNAEWHLRSESFVSNGPFILKAWQHSNIVTLEKNGRYWQADAVRLNQIDFAIASPDTALQMFEDEKLDWIGSPFSMIPTDAVRSLKKCKNLSISPFLATSFFRINTSPSLNGKENPLADAKVRRAFLFAIDREAIVEHILQGGQKAAYTLVPAEMGLNTPFPSIEKEPIDQRIKDPITISYLNNERNAAVAQAVQKQWENQLKVQVFLEAVEPKVFFQRISKMEYEIALGSWTADFNDPVNFLEVFKYKKGSTNNTGWENADYVDLLNRSSVCKAGEERERLLRLAEEILMRDAPIIPIYHFALNFVKNRKLAGTVLSPMGNLDFRWAYFEQKEEMR